MDKIPSSLFPPPRAYLVYQEPAQRGYRLATTTSRAPFYLPETEEHHNTPPDIPTGGERSHLFGQAQKNSGDDCCCIMTPAALPIHPPDCEECVQGCEDPSCIVELTPQCTDQCVVVCDDTHHSVGGCIDDTSGGFMCPDATDCSIMDDLFCCAEYHPSHADGKSSLVDPHGHNALWDPAFDHLLHHVNNAYQASPVDYYGHTSNSNTQHQGLHTHLDSFPSASMPSPTYNIASSSLADALNPVHTSPPSNALKCMWGNCSAVFNNMAELVGHVNLQHLRLPGSGPVPSQDNSASNSIQGMDFSCLWADCQQYPDVSAIPGSSTSNPVDSALGVLANHLLHDHLGLSSPLQPQPQQTNVTKSVSPSTTWTPEPMPLVSPPESAKSSTLSPSGPPTPAPEHDCSSPSHVCRWIGCGQSFMTCDELTTHITATHVGGGKNHYDCYWEGCSRHGDSGFASKQKICRHLQSHTGHRPFQCGLCKQHFSEAATLAQHMRRHTQERPYICDYPGCGKSFAITGALTIHKRTHNGHKPFKCTYCERAFAESSNLSKHLRTHTGARPYSCTHPGCAKTFARPDQLARHMSVHRKKIVDVPDQTKIPQVAG